MDYNKILLCETAQMFACVTFSLMSFDQMRLVSIFKTEHQ